LSNFHQLW